MRAAVRVSHPGQVFCDFEHSGLDVAFVEYGRRLGAGSYFDKES